MTRIGARKEERVACLNPSKARNADYRTRSPIVTVAEGCPDSIELGSAVSCWRQSFGFPKWGIMGEAKDRGWETQVGRIGPLDAVS
jgi:hypothetical protein